MALLAEFKKFALRGNVVDLAVAVVIGGAFGKIVSSLVADIIMPPVGLLIGGVDFTDLAVTLKPAAGDVPAVELSYGKFLQTAVDFLFIAMAVFAMVKGINRLQAPPEPAAPPPPSKEVVLLEEIRDLLAAAGKPTPKT